MRIDMGTWNVTHYDMANTTDVNLAISGMRYAFAHDGFVYLKTSNSPYDIYKLEIGNSANVIKIKQTGMLGIQGYPQLAVNDRIYYENYNHYLYIVNAQTNEVLMPENSCIYSTRNYLACFTPLLNEPMLYFSSIGSYATGGFFMLSNYLGTINNLSDSVTKTADKTMKITYIIQEQ
jgi:hypothetical protein